MRNHENSIAAIITVAEKLQTLVHPCVFVGGATVGLYIDTPVPEIRVTLDVDCVVQVTVAQMAQLTEKLIAAGFCPTPPINCRYTYRQIIVDIMPADPKVLSFSNRWYPDGIVHRRPYPIDAQHNIEIFSFPYFVASKLEAFKSRGDGDWAGLKMLLHPSK